MLQTSNCRTSRYEARQLTVGLCLQAQGNQTHKQPLGNMLSFSGLNWDPLDLYPDKNLHLYDSTAISCAFPSGHTVFPLYASPPSTIRLRHRQGKWRRYLRNATRRIFFSVFAFKMGSVISSSVATGVRVCFSGKIESPPKFHVFHVVFG